MICMLFSPVSSFSTHSFCVCGIICFTIIILTLCFLSVSLQRSSTLYQKLPRIRCKSYHFIFIHFCNERLMHANTHTLISLLHTYTKTCQNPPPPFFVYNVSLRFRFWWASRVYVLWLVYCAIRASGYDYWFIVLFAFAVYANGSSVIFPLCCCAWLASGYDWFIAPRFSRLLCSLFSYCCVCTYFCYYSIFFWAGKK